ncbi:hypothetical protein BX600DRAFT_297035 [Xylariales sp. PMI_506]|nr:hypothetical protein BX600DRAFT_297035 [Xylariales sp. PMI_506]
MVLGGDGSCGFTTAFSRILRGMLWEVKSTGRTFWTFFYLLISSFVFSVLVLFGFFFSLLKGNGISNYLFFWCRTDDTSSHLLAVISASLSLSALSGYQGGRMVRQRLTQPPFLCSPSRNLLRYLKFAFVAFARLKSAYCAQRVRKSLTSCWSGYEVVFLST